MLPYEETEYSRTPYKTLIFFIIMTDVNTPVEATPENEVVKTEETVATPEVTQTPEAAQVEPATETPSVEA